MDQKTEACGREAGTGSQYTWTRVCTHTQAHTLLCHFQAWALSKVRNLRDILLNICSAPALYTRWVLGIGGCITCQELMGWENKIQILFSSSNHL